MTTTHITKEGLLQAIEEQRGLALLDGYKPTQLDNILARAAELSAQDTPQQCAYGEFDGFKEICTKVATVNRRGYHLCKPCADRQLAAEIKADMDAEAFYDRQRFSAQESKPDVECQHCGERFGHDIKTGNAVKCPKCKTVLYLFKNPAAPSVSAQDASPKDGWKLVPLEPTQEMLMAGAKAGCSTEVLLDDTPFSCDMACWKAMLATSPEPPTCK